MWLYLYFKGWCDCICILKGDVTVHICILKGHMTVFVLHWFYSRFSGDIKHRQEPRFAELISRTQGRRVGVLSSDWPPYEILDSDWSVLWNNPLLLAAADNSSPSVGQDKKQKVRFLWQTFARLMCADDTNFFYLYLLIQYLF